MDKIKESLIKNQIKNDTIKIEERKHQRYEIFIFKKKDPASNGSTNNLYTWEDK